MPDPGVDPKLTERIERQLAESQLSVVVEASDDALMVSGIVDSEEARQAALDIVASVAPGVRMDDQLEIESVLPEDVDRFASGEPSAELFDDEEDLERSGELDPDFTDQPLLRDPLAAAGPYDTEDRVESGDQVYSPPDDPVLTTDAHGRAQVLGGFGDATDDTSVEPSAMDRRIGDEALADAIRRELREDAATTDLSILVAVREGVVHLRGQVADLDDAENAEAVASRVPGVREVVEELDVAGV